MEHQQMAKGLSKQRAKTCDSPCSRCPWLSPAFAFNQILVPADRYRASCIEHAGLTAHGPGSADLPWTDHCGLR